LPFEALHLAWTRALLLRSSAVELMWGVGPVTKARLAEIGVLTIGQLAKTPGWSLEWLLGPAAGEKLAALAWNRDPADHAAGPARAFHLTIDGCFIAPIGVVVNAIRRVGDHQVRLDAAEHALDVRRHRAVAAEETMPPEQPQIARL
jgi:hypothetical protein